MKIHFPLNRKRKKYFEKNVFCQFLWAPTQSSHYRVHLKIDIFVTNKSNMEFFKIKNLFCEFLWPPTLSSHPRVFQMSVNHGISFYCASYSLYIF